MTSCFAITPGAYEPPKAVKECTSASYQKINCAPAVLIESVVVIARVQSSLTVSSIFGSFLVVLAARFMLPHV